MGAGGGIRINNVKISGGADGVTFVPSYNEETGILSWQAQRNGQQVVNYTVPADAMIKGKDGADGKDGKTGAKLEDQQKIGEDENGWIYEQTFDDGTKWQFTAPRGESGLTNITNIEDSADFNDFLQLGAFLFSRHTYAEASQNCPSSYAGILYVYSATNNKNTDENVSYRNILQRYEDTNGNVYIRNEKQSNGVHSGWNEWRRIATSKDLDSKQDQLFAGENITIEGNVISASGGGSNKAVSFVNYSTMILTLLTLSSTAYMVGQNIMIVTLEVPDLWVSEIAEESVAYTYVSDTDFVTELTTNGSVQVGYYKLSALETQKVDLTNYVKNTDYAKQGWGSKSTGVIAFYSSPQRAGIALHQEGASYPFISPANNTTFLSRDGGLNAPLVPKHINAIVKGALTGDKRIGQGTIGTDAWAVAEFTDIQKAQARSILGFEGKYLHKVTITSTVTQTQKVETTTMLILSSKEEALTVEEILTEEKDNIFDITRNDGTKWTISQFIYQPESMGIVFEFYAGGDYYDYYFASVEEVEQSITDVVLS